MARDLSDILFDVGSQPQTVPELLAQELPGNLLRGLELIEQQKKRRRAAMTLEDIFRGQQEPPLREFGRLTVSEASELAPLMRAARGTQELDPFSTLLLMNILPAEQRGPLLEALAAGKKPTVPGVKAAAGTLTALEAQEERERAAKAREELTADQRRTQKLTELQTRIDESTRAIEKGGISSKEEARLRAVILDAQRERARLEGKEFVETPGLLERFIKKPLEKVKGKVEIVPKTKKSAIQRLRERLRGL